MFLSREDIKLLVIRGS